MSKNWPTKIKDVHLAQTIMEEFAYKQQSETLSFFELVVDTAEKRMNFRLSTWVCALAEQFNSLYGADHGDYVTRQVLSHCITHGQTVH